MQIWAESGKSALPICNYSQILYQFLTFTQNLKRSRVGKHSWHIIDSVRGANASALLYSIAETAKANNLKPYQYFVYLLTELMKYPWDNVPDNALEKIMPWSPDLPDSCRKTKTR